MSYLIFVCYNMNICSNEEVTNMLTRSHRLCSIALVELGLIASNAFIADPASNLITLLATGVGASLPDIDEYNSTTSRKSPINFSLFLRHRGVTHSFLGWLVFSIGLYFIMNHFIPIQFRSWQLPNWWGSIWLGLILGYFLHLVEDSFSKRGVDWWAPFVKKRRHHSIFRYKVGGFFEKFITLIAFLGIIMMSCYWLWLLAAPEI